MPGTPKHYSSETEKLPGSKIYINVKHLEKGDYELNIMNQNKLIKKTTFKKK